MCPTAKKKFECGGGVTYNLGVEVEVCFCEKSFNGKVSIFSAKKKVGVFFRPEKKEWKIIEVVSPGVLKIDADQNQTANVLGLSPKDVCERLYFSGYS